LESAPLDDQLHSESYNLQLKVQLKAVPVEKAETETKLSGSMMVQELKRLIDAVRITE